MQSAIQALLSPLGFEESLINEIAQNGHLVKVRPGAPLISPGTKPEDMPMVISGTMRVMREDAEGNELFLYYLEGGEACAMSISCCMSAQLAQFKAVAETEAQVWMVPMHMIDSWMAGYRSFRKFVIDSYQSRFDELMQTVDSIAFMKMDERLLKYLLDKKQSSGSYEIHKSHEQIASELNTSRVVISRLLKKLEKADRVSLHRNKIEIL